MRRQLRPGFDRRGILRMFAIGVTAATAGESASAQTRTSAEKRRAHYRADSPEVQTFYRVNCYPAK